jgi:O-antigen ligase
MFSFLGIIFALFFLGFCFWRWSWALGFFCLTLPAYLIRLTYLGLPTTILEIMWGGLVLSWSILYGYKDWPVIKSFFKNNRWFGFFFALFFLASIIGIFTSDMWFKSLGQWRAYFFEPMILFLILIGRSRNLDRRFPLFGLLGSGLVVSLVAVLQKTTFWFYPPSLWNDKLDGRVTSFFTSPNAVGLFLLPLIPLAVWLAIDAHKERQSRQAVFWSIVFLLFLVAIFLSFSQGAWIGLGAAVIIFLFRLGYQKVAAGLVILGVIAALVIPDIRTAVFFQDRASQNRLVLWSDTSKFLISSPSNFVLGAGVRQFFRKVEKSHYDPKVMERLIYPHNIFLNFWSEIGLLGMVGFAGLLISVFGWVLKSQDKLSGAIFFAAWVGFVVHGLVDVPYFKNDLAFLFWVLVFFSWRFSQIGVLEKK